MTITVDSDAIKVSGSKGNLETLSLRASSNHRRRRFNRHRDNDEPKNCAKHGSCAPLLTTWSKGVTTGFSKKLEINGVGFRVALAGDTSNELGFSHEVNLQIASKAFQAEVQQNTYYRQRY